MDTQKRWVSAQEFAAYLGVSRDQVYRLMESDPAVKRVTRRFGGRVLVCLYMFQRWEEGLLEDAS